MLREVDLAEWEKVAPSWMTRARAPSGAKCWTFAIPRTCGSREKPIEF